MSAVKVAAVFLVLLILLSGCQNGDKPGKTSDIDDVKTWFEGYASDYEIVDVQTHESGKYILLTTFTPPGETEHYTMVRAYVVRKDKNSYAVDAIKDAYEAGSVGFSAAVSYTHLDVYKRQLLYHIKIPALTPGHFRLLRKIWSCIGTVLPTMGILTR